MELIVPYYDNIIDLNGLFCFCQVGFVFLLWEKRVGCNVFAKDPEQDGMARKQGEKNNLLPHPATGMHAPFRTREKATPRRLEPARRC